MAAGEQAPTKATGPPLAPEAPHCRRHGGHVSEEPWMATSEQSDADLVVEVGGVVEVVELEPGEAGVVDHLLGQLAVEAEGAEAGAAGFR